MALALVKPWKTQPYRTVGVNWNNSIASKLSFAWTPLATGHFDLVSGIQGTVVGTGGIKAFAPGIAFESSAGTSHGISFGSGLLQRVISNGNKYYTIFSLANPPSTSTRMTLFAHGSDAAPFRQHTLMVNAKDGNPVAVAGYVELNEYGGGGAGDPGAVIFKDSNANTYINSRWNTYAGVRNNNQAFIYVNGVDVSQSGGTLTSNAATIDAGAVYVSGVSGASRALTSGNILVYVWNRALTSGEVFSLSANPWQLFTGIEVLGPPTPYPILSNLQATRGNTSASLRTNITY